MKTLKVPRGQHPVLQSLTRKDIAVIRKYPKILAETKSVIRAFKSVIKKLDGIPEHASKRKRKTALKRVIAICKKTVERIEE
jgi:hypothetical protein